MQLDAVVSDRDAYDIGGSDYPVLVTDISPKGAAFTSDKKWPCGLKVDLIIHFNERHVNQFSYDLSVKVHIVHEGFAAKEDAALYGVKFEGVSGLLNWKSLHMPEDCLY